MRPKHCFLIIASFFWLAACGSNQAPAKPTRLTVMAAASLQTAFEAIGQQFEAQQPGPQVEFNFAGSQQLAQQITNFAMADVFASANLKQMNVVVDSGRINKEGAQIFTQNRLVMIVPKANPAGLKSFMDLSLAGIKLVFADESVPAGQYTLEFLEKASRVSTLGIGYKKAVLENVVSYEENIKAVLAKISLGEADAGIVYSSDVTGEAGQNVQQITIPDEFNITGTYTIAALNDSLHPELAQAFIDFVLSKDGQDILLANGFLPAP